MVKPEDKHQSAIKLVFSTFYLKIQKFSDRVRGWPCNQVNLKARIRKWLEALYTIVIEFFYSETSEVGCTYLHGSCWPGSLTIYKMRIKISCQFFATLINFIKGENFKTTYMLMHYLSNLILIFAWITAAYRLKISMHYLEIGILYLKKIDGRTYVSLFCLDLSI